MTSRLLWTVVSRFAVRAWLQCVCENERLRRFAVRKGLAFPYDGQELIGEKGWAPCRKGRAFPHSRAAKPLRTQWLVFTPGKLRHYRDLPWLAKALLCRMQSRQPILDRRQSRKRGVRFFLVPIGHRVVVIGAVVGVPVLDRGAQGLREGD